MAATPCIKRKSCAQIVIFHYFKLFLSLVSQSYTNVMTCFLWDMLINTHTHTHTQILSLLTYTLRMVVCFPVFPTVITQCENTRTNLPSHTHKLVHCYTNIYVSVPPSWEDISKNTSTLPQRGWEGTFFVCCVCVRVCGWVSVWVVCVCVCCVCVCVSHG